MRDLHVVARSGNTKTGDIPVTYRPMRTCEPTCPFLPSKDSGGCYGTGRIFAMAEKLTGERSADDVDATLAKRNPAARYMRDRVVGDVIDVDADGSVTVDVEYIEAVADAAARNDLTAFGYSHAWPRFTPEDVARMAASGYVMNASCETPADVDAALAMGLPATIANDDVAEGAMIGGGRVVTCPAQTRDDVDCASCGLCAKPQRKAVVRFLIHGTAKRKATAAVAARMEE
jgi:hypothetical protein